MLKLEKGRPADCAGRLERSPDVRFSGQTEYRI